MKKFLGKVKSFFFPPADTPAHRRVLPYAVLGVLTLVVFVAGSYGWEYTNSPAFCGTTCHTMPPEYSAYLVSPHARVQCVECHIGRGVFATRFTRKAGDLRHVFLNITGNYEYPIMARKMRPARETCETCHFPSKFSDDSLVQLNYYLANEDNTPYSIFLVLKTGGGAAREGLGYGIHWHVENEVYYYATDELEQEIPFVRVIDAEGNTSEYVDLGSEVDPTAIQDDQLRRMDCITCHNRITHSVPKPTVAISQAVSKGLISSDLPYVVREGIALLSAEYPDKDSAIAEMASLADFYEQNYPEVYANQIDQIEQAIATLQDIYNQNVFPDQLMDWNTHPDNIGHKTDPGCFRCHDGEHLSTEGEAIRLECNICHAIPVVSRENQLTTNIEIGNSPEPVSHTLTTWMALHGRVKDNSCKACHTTPAGIPDLSKLTVKPPVDDSFCGNEACHSNTWTYAAFESPELEPILNAQYEELLASMPTEPETPPSGALTYEGSIQAMLTTRCSACHGEAATAGLNVTTYQSLLAGGDGGPGVVPEDLQASLLYQRQTEASPHYVQLSADEVKMLEEWILAGAPEN